MNDMKEILNNTMDRLSPERDIVSAAKARARSDAKKISVKRFFCIAAAVCGVLICGITAAAATGLIDFEAVFGDYIVVKNSELANSLVGRVKNFKYKVSDDDYKIEIKGVTGDENSLVGFAEISRVDGTPVKDHFINPTDEIALSALWEEPGMELFYGSQGGGYGSHINEDGNIEFFFDISSDRDLTGKKFKVKSKNFYPDEAYFNFKKDNNISYMKWEDFAGYAKLDENESAGNDNIVPADIDDSGIIALELEWEFSFVYEPSEAALKTKICPDTDEDFVLYQYSTKWIPNEDGGAHSDPDSRVDLETAADCTYIEIGPMSGRIKFRYELTEYHQQSFVSERSATNDSEKNVFFLITSDGETIPVKIGAGTGSGGGKNKIYECDYELVYPDENGKYKAIETENVTAISINGTVYELS